MSLRFRILGLFFAVAVVPLLALGAYEYTRALRAVEVMIADQNARLANRIAASVSERVALLNSDLLMLSENADTERWLVGVAEGRAADIDKREAERFARDAWTRIGASYAGLIFSDARGTPLLTLGQDDGMSAPSAEVAPSVTADVHASGRDIPVGRVQLRPMLAGLLPFDLLATAFGAAGQSLVIDREQQRAVFGSPRTLAGETVTNLGLREYTASNVGTLDSTQRGTWRYVHRDTLRIASYVHLASPAWTIVVTGAVQEFSQPFTLVRRDTLLLFIAVALVGTVIFSQLLKRTTRSLEELTAAADVMRAGNLTPVLPAGGDDEVGRLASSFDAMTRRIRDMVTQIESSRQMAVLGTFAAQLSHEVRNPLTSIKLNLQRLERQARRGAMSDASVAPLEIALRESERLDRVVRGVLALSRHHPGIPQAVPPLPLIRELCNSVQAQAETQRVRIDVVAPRPCRPAHIDPEQLRGALLNLFVNALDVMPDGGTLTVFLEDEGHAGIRLVVSDTGPGIPEHDMDQLFRPFFTTKHDGTGLGLALARRAIEESGGTLTMANGTSDGATFVMTLVAASGPVPS